MIKNDHPMIAFTQSIDYLTDDYRQLQQQFKEIRQEISMISLEDTHSDIMNQLNQLKGKIVSFMKHSKLHFEEEKRTLFPVLRQYTDLKEAELIEQERHIADIFVQGYINYLKPWEKADPKEIISFLEQAFILMENHMDIDKKIVLNTAERIMDDLEYLSC